MCYDDDARPPQPPGASSPAHGEDLVLTAADGNRFMAYLAQPDGPATAQLVIYPDVRGLHTFYKELAMRFAEQGVRAIAIDYFGRTAGLSARDDSFEFMPHVLQLQLPTFYADVQAALDQLQQGAGGAQATFVLGFCMGGGLALRSGTQDFGWAGIVAFYPGLSRPMGAPTTVLDVADQSKYPILGLFGGADQGIPPEQVAELDQKLTKAGVEHTLITYPGAPHSFFDRKAVEFADASADAWQRALGFIATHAAQ